MLLASTSMAAEKKLLHCFAFTAVETATKADWDAFYKATDDIPKKIKGVSHVWYGKLQRPFTVEGGVARQYAVCMDMDSAEARKNYGSDPYHKIWNDAYSKLRVEGTTTFDIPGQ
jgi:hypothetical protein